MITTKLSCGLYYPFILSTRLFTSYTISLCMSILCFPLFCFSFFCLRVFKIKLFLLNKENFLIWKLFYYSWVLRECPSFIFFCIKYFPSRLLEIPFKYDSHSLGWIIFRFVIKIMEFILTLPIYNYYPSIFIQKIALRLCYWFSHFHFYIYFRTRNIVKRQRLFCM